MQPEPRNQAVSVVSVPARHLLHLRVLLELVLADRALVHLRVQQLVVDGDCGEILDGVLGGWRRAVTVGIVVGEELNQLLKAGAEVVVAKVGRGAKPVVGRVAEGELNVGAISAKALKVVLEVGPRVEHVGFAAGPGTGVEQEREHGIDQIERKFGIQRFSTTLVDKIRVMAMVVRVPFFHETFQTDRAERFRLIGARDPLIAHVAEKWLPTVSAGRHHWSSSSSSLIATQPLLFSGFLFFSL